MCVCVDSVHEASLVGGLFMSHLRQTASALHKGLDPKQFLDDVTSHKAILDMVWQLGSATPHSSVSESALRVFCTCFLAKSWAWTPTSTKRGASSKDKRATGSHEGGMVFSFPSTDFNDNVAEVLSRLFVYLFCKLVQLEWLQKSQSAKTHTIRMLQRVISLLRPADLGKFLPKIMFAVESSLSHPAPQVQLAGAYLVEEVASRLPTPVLEDSAALLIVGLYPLLELSLEQDLEQHRVEEGIEPEGHQHQGQGQDQHQHQLSEQKIAFLQHLALSDLRLDHIAVGEDRGNMAPVEKVVATRLAGESCSEGGVSSLCSVLLPHVKAAAAWHQRQAQSVAVRTLNKMFVEMGEGGGGLQKALRGLPFIPPLPGLR